MERDFAALYAGIGRPSIAPEKLLRAIESGGAKLVHGSGGMVPLRAA
jgi:hypothetical protein